MHKTIIKFFSPFVLVLFLLSSASAEKYQVYFNHQDGMSYTDPYRGVTRIGANFEKIIISAIDQSTTSLWLAVQEMNTPLIAKALVRAKNRGVDVRMVMENLYNLDFKQIDLNNLEQYTDYFKDKIRQHMFFLDVDKNKLVSAAEFSQRDALSILRENGIKFVDDTNDGSKGSGLMHHKFVIVDGKSLVVTSANFTLSDIHGDYDDTFSVGNANALLVIDEVEVAKLFTKEFSIMWGDGGRVPTSRFGINKVFRGLQAVQFDGVKLSVQFSPMSKAADTSKSVNDVIIREISNARESIYADLFVFSTQSIANAMYEVYQNHSVDLEVLIDRGFATREYSELLDMWGIELKYANTCKIEKDNKIWDKKITKGGVARLAEGDKLHHKFAVIDGKKVLFGSHNWSDAANFLNDETFMVIESEEIASAFTKEHKRLMKNAFLGPSKTLLEKVDSVNHTCP